MVFVRQNIKFKNPLFSMVIGLFLTICYDISEYFVSKKHELLLFCNNYYNLLTIAQTVENKAFRRFCKNFLKFTRFDINFFIKKHCKALFFNKKIFRKFKKKQQKTPILDDFGWFFDLWTFDFVAIVQPCSTEPRRWGGHRRARYSRVTSL